MLSTNVHIKDGSRLSFSVKGAGENIVKNIVPSTLQKNLSAKEKEIKHFYYQINIKPKCDVRHS